ncbi:YlzJ-like family protein [Acetivibrio clariflavus]|uniref:YlzJ-like protein n=1 Tax=Acetivibrio clariflavus (strain DSM 19732 / NBRC 101661 / EBR45) TaxID=720554 RepID=G8M176_ACECE|nr:YlzJ-like family protein [Acetivibrio clariflavus]AEV68052.1 hypothetical protein Clocl_1401 [Acetivibrio clariflavus DSM 19732]
MLLHSIIPTELVFGNYYNTEDFNYIELEYEGEKIEVIPLSGSTYKINRVISTSLKAYLNPKLMPGNIIESKL